jgi:hypothetical protein
VERQGKYLSSSTCFAEKKETSGLKSWGGKMEVKDVVAEEVKVNLETLRVARYGRHLYRDVAQQRIVDAVIEGLNSEDRARLAEYERQEDPCLSEER